MLNRFLICNQYELFGNFDSIREMRYFQILADTHGDELLDDENLYRMLGYKAAGSLSLTQTVQLRRVLMSGDDNRILHVLSSIGEDTSKGSCAFDAAKKYHLKDLYKSKVEHKVCPASDMLVQYLINTDDIVCTYNGVSVPYNTYANLRACRSSYGIASADLVKDQIEVVETDGLSHVVNRVAFVNRKDLGGFRKPHSILKAATDTITRRKEFITQLGITNVTEIPSLWFTSVEKYVWLLDYAASLGMTLAQLLLYAGIGVVVVDQREVFESFGMGMYTCGDSVFYVAPGDKELRKTPISCIDTAFRLRDMNLGAITKMSSF